MCICNKLIESSLSEVNIHHSMSDFRKENTNLFVKKYQGILPTTMLISLVKLNIFVSDVYMDAIANIKCHLHSIHL